MIYFFNNGNSLPGRKNYDCGEYEASILETEIALNGLIRIPNSRGNDSVILQAVTVPFVENGQKHHFPVPILVAPLLAELDPDWTSFGNIISEHFDIFTSARRHEMHISPNEMAVVDAIKANFSIVKITVPGKKSEFVGNCLHWEGGIRNMVFL